MPFLRPFPGNEARKLFSGLWKGSWRGFWRGFEGSFSKTLPKPFWDPFRARASVAGMKGSCCLMKDSSGQQSLPGLVSGSSLWKLAPALQKRIGGKQREGRFPKPLWGETRFSEGFRGLLRSHFPSRNLFQKLENHPNFAKQKTLM